MWNIGCIKILVGIYRSNWNLKYLFYIIWKWIYYNLINTQSSFCWYQLKFRTDFSWKSNMWKSTLIAIQNHVSFNKITSKEKRKIRISGNKTKQSNSYLKMKILNALRPLLSKNSVWTSVSTEAALFEFSCNEQ